MNRVATALLLIYAVVATLGWLNCYGDPKPTLIDASPACVAKPLPNPCATVNCNRIDRRIYT